MFVDNCCLLCDIVCCRVLIAVVVSLRLLVGVGCCALFAGVCCLLIGVWCLLVLVMNCVLCVVWCLLCVVCVKSVCCSLCDCCCAVWLSVVVFVDGVRRCGLLS